MNSCRRHWFVFTLVTPPQLGRRLVWMLIDAQFLEACIINSEVVSDLMADHVFLSTEKGTT